MSVDFILQSAHLRGVELLKTFAHEPNYTPHISIDNKTHKAVLIVDSLNSQTQRSFPVNVLTNVPKRQASDVLSMVYRDCVSELRLKKRF